MSTRVGSPRIKGNTTYYRLSTDRDETPVRLHDDIAEIVDRLGSEECSVGKVEVRYVNRRGEEKRAEILFDDEEGNHRDVYKTWQYSQQSNQEIPLWFFNVKYRGNKFRIKLDVPNQRMAIAVSTRDEDMSVFDEFMHSLEGKNDWSHREPPRRQTGRQQPNDMDDYMTQPYDGDYDEDKLDANDMANLVDDGYGNQGGYDDRGYDPRYDDRGGYDDRGYGDGYDDGYDDQGYDDQGYDDRYGDQGGYDDRGYDPRYDDQGGYDDRGYDDQGYDPRYDDRGYDPRYDDQAPQQDGRGSRQGMTPPPGNNGEIIDRDPFGKYFGLAVAEVAVSSIAGLALIILLNMETHLGISITSALFCGILLVVPLLAVSALVRILSAHKKIKDDYLQGMRAYDKARKRMIIVLVLMIVWVVVLGYLGFLWYTHSLPPQLSGIYDLLDHQM